MRAVAAAVVVAVLTSVAWAAQTGAVFSRQQLECLASRKVLHAGRCYPLLEKGPCAAGSRLTLDVSALPVISATCSTCRCCDVPRAVWWHADGACRRTRDEDELCANGTYLGEDLFGDGACLCRPGHARTPGRHSGPCHALYHRGPCARGQVLKAEEADNATCVDDPCARENSRPGNSTSAMAPDGVCYPLSSRGPCPENSSFNVHPETLQPQCIDRTYHIIKLPCLSKVADTNGGCKNEVQPQDDNIFGRLLVQSAKHKGRARRTASRRTFMLT